MSKLRLSKTARKTILDIAHSYGVNVRLEMFTDCSGMADYSNGVIYLNLSKDHNKTMRHMFSTLFHEIGHCVAYKERKFKAYHHRKEEHNLTYQDKLAIVRTGLRAEQYVDRWGEREFKKYYPNERYARSYRNKEDRTWFHKHVLKDYLYPED